MVKGNIRNRKGDWPRTAKNWRIYEEITLQSCKGNVG